MSRVLQPEQHNDDAAPSPQTEEASQRSWSAMRARLFVGVAVIAVATLIVLAAGAVLEIGDPDHDESHLNVSELSFDNLAITEGSSSSSSPDNSGNPDNPVIPGSRKLGEYRGKPLVVNFFASWCPPCVREMPEFQQVFERLEGQVAFLGLSQDRSAQDALDLVAATGVTYDIGWDLDLEIYQATESIAMPTTAFISPDGDLLDTFAGLLNEAALIQRIRSLFNIAIDG